MKHNLCWKMLGWPLLSSPWGFVKSHSLVSINQVVFCKKKNLQYRKHISQCRCITSSFYLFILILTNIYNAAPFKLFILINSFKREVTGYITSESEPTPHKYKQHGHYCGNIPTVIDSNSNRKRIKRFMIPGIVVQCAKFTLDGNNIWQTQYHNSTVYTFIIQYEHKAASHTLQHKIQLCNYHWYFSHNNA